MFAFKLFPMPVRLIEKDLISRMKCSLPYSWRGWPKISWTSQTIFNQNINSWVTWDSVISHFYVNSSKKGQHSYVTQLSRSVIDFLLKLAVSINYHFTKLKKFKSTHDTVILWTSKSYKLRRRPSQWSENSIVLVHWRFFRLTKEYLSRMPKLESAELLHLRKTNVGHKVNIPHASVFRFTNIFIDESKRFMPGAYLQTYRGVPLWFSVIVAVLSFGGAATLTGAIIFLIFGFPFITIYWQNEQVNRKSLPLVKKQSVKNDLQTLDALYEVTFKELQTIALSSYDLKIGFTKTTAGKFSFQVFHPVAFQIMDKAKRISRIMLGVFLFLALYNTFFIFLYSLILKEWINHVLYTSCL